MNEKQPVIENPEHQKWLRACQEAKELSIQINKELIRIFQNDPENFRRLSQEIFYPKVFGNVDLREYAVYHAAIGSTTSFEQTPKIDLPGENTLMSFWEQKLKELTEM